jgi:hypothetical protein
MLQDDDRSRHIFADNRHVLKDITSEVRARLKYAILPAMQPHKIPDNSSITVKLRRL